jgi:hypothetical protein
VLNTEIRNSKNEIRGKSEIQNPKSQISLHAIVSSFLPLAFGICIVFLFSTFGFAQTTPPATNPASNISSWFTDLANRDAKVRDQARYNLMGINRDELQTLCAQVKAKLPLAPSQAVALKEIVTHVFLATESYPPFPGTGGFLGVSYQGVSRLADPVDDDVNGVVVMDRMAGFCAYRVLQDGDVLVGVIDDAGEHPIRTREDLGTAVNRCRSGDTIRLQVLRGGQTITVDVTLNARPIWAPPGIQQPRDELRERQRRADEYWEKNFETLIDDGVS